MADQTTVYVSPSYNNVVGLMVFAMGGDAASARGAADPPIPERCCAVCDGVAYDNATHALHTDLFRQTPFACVGFALQFLQDTTIHGWYCNFYTTTDTVPFQDTGQGTHASHVYTRGVS